MNGDSPLTSDRGAWEAAYQVFETPQQEVQKFRRRLIGLGLSAWEKNLRIIELFCGRGNGLIALEKLGFVNLDGLDLSPDLIGSYRGRARRYIGDARHLPIKDSSYDAIVVQGGLHHVELMGDLKAVIAEMYRILRPSGRLVVVEPWLTPFLHVVHAVCRVPAARRLSRRVQALATMIELEIETYESWLNAPDAILQQLRRHFDLEDISIRFGKLMLVGTRRAAINQTAWVAEQELALSTRKWRVSCR